MNNKSGSRRWLQYNLEPVLHKRGKLRGMYPKEIQVSSAEFFNAASQRFSPSPRKEGVFPNFGFAAVSFLLVSLVITSTIHRVFRA
jgi:hypothetical protein